MIPRKQINKYKKRTGGLFIILLCDGTPKAVKREFIADIVEKGFYKHPHLIKKCYRLKKHEMLRLSASYNAMVSPHIGMSIPEFHKQFYSEVIMQKPYAYAKIIR